MKIWDKRERCDYNWTLPTQEANKRKQDDSQSNQGLFKKMKNETRSAWNSEWDIIAPHIYQKEAKGKTNKKKS